MPLIEYVSRNFSAAARRMINKANEIIDEYREQGFDLTLRQLYYQFVSRDLIANKDTEYKRLGGIISDARMAGMIDWEAIVDRTRALRKNSHWANPREILETCVQSYQIDKWDNQKTRIEVWIEKDALVGVIERTCQALDVAFFSCRGYTSQSEMWVASQRHIEYLKSGQRVVILHLGDHDPSGLDMTRDIRDRLMIFTNDARMDWNADSDEAPLLVSRIALTTEQVKKYNPPPNPAKVTDSRSGPYIEEFGNESWELDALNPKMLDALIREEVLDVRDNTRWKQAVKKETSHITQLKTAMKSFKD